MGRQKSISNQQPGREPFNSTKESDYVPEFTYTQVGIDLKTIIKLRDDLLETLAAYCSELGQDLLFEFDDQIMEKAKKLPIDIDVARKFTLMQRAIDEAGVYKVGSNILCALMEMVNEDLNKSK